MSIAASSLNYAPTMDAESRAKMNKFVMGISELVVNEYRSNMIIPIMDISRLMVHAKQIEGLKLKQVGRELKKVSTEEGNSSMNRFEVQDKLRFKRKFFNQVPPNFQRLNKSKLPNPKLNR